MHEGTPTSAAISPEEVEAELQRILASPIFRRAPGHTRFLEFVVQKTLAGPANLIKEYSIGVEVFGRRSSDYDTGLDPGVRVEAGRLRLRLAKYYQTLGKHDQVRIELPRGTYVPVFHRNGVEPTLEEAASETPNAPTAWHGRSAANGAKQNGAIEVQPGVASGNTGARLGSQASRLSVLKIMAAVAGIAIATFIFPRIVAKDSRPQAGRLEGSTLIISNAKGDELWRKSFPEGFSRGYYEQASSSLPSRYEQSAPPRMWFGDLEGKGRSDVLLLYQPDARAMSHSTTLICYSDRGKERWRWTPGRALPELEGDPAIYRIDSFVVLKGARKEPSRIVVSSSHFLWYPQQIAVLNSDGKLVSEYWHSGHLYNLALADLDGDGREEIIATGISNGHRQATLVVLDPERVFGASTEAVPHLQIHGMGVAKERLRLLFPRSDLNKATSLYNTSEEANILQDRIQVSAQECQQIPRCVILYDFDRGFHLLSVVADDQFRAAHDEYYLRNKPAHRFSAEEEREFRKVRCLVGCKTEFVLSQNH